MGDGAIWLAYDPGVPGSYGECTYDSWDSLVGKLAVAISVVWHGRSADVGSVVGSVEKVAGTGGVVLSARIDI